MGLADETLRRKERALLLERSSARWFKAEEI